jgi:hypothetical protein
MTVMTRIPGRPDWAAGPLYNKLLDIFPTYRTPLGVLDVQKLKRDLGKSHEAIYKWLRNGKVTPDNAREIVRVATSESNVAALTEVDRQPPVFEDFCPFF